MKSAGIEEVAGGGGKKELAKAALFSSLVLASEMRPAEVFALRVGTLDGPPLLNCVDLFVAGMVGEGPHFV